MATSRIDTDLVERLTREAREFEARLRELSAERDQLQELVKRLREQLTNMGTERPRVAVQNLASSFRSLLETTQPDPARPPEGDVAATLRSLEIDLKAFVEITDGRTEIVVPKAGEQVDPNMLSTLRLSFGTVPVMRQPEPEPVTEGGGRRRAVRSDAPQPSPPTAPVSPPAASPPPPPPAPVRTAETPRPKRRKSPTVLAAEIQNMVSSMTTPAAGGTAPDVALKEPLKVRRPLKLKRRKKKKPK